MPDFSDPSIQARDPRTPTATAITTILGASRLLKTKMAPTNLSHRQTHNLLLISKLLSLRDTASPLTLLLDTLEQPATPLIREYIRRAKVSSCFSFQFFSCRFGIRGSVPAQMTSYSHYAGLKQPSTDFSKDIQSSYYSHFIRDIEVTRWSRRLCLSSKKDSRRDHQGSRNRISAHTVGEPFTPYAIPSR